MKVTIQRAAFLKCLQIISGVVERRQTLPILANVLITVKECHLSLTATDHEIELIGNVVLEEPAESGRTTVSARKLLDICRALPEDAVITMTLEGDHVILRSGKSRFLLTTLPADDFPSIEESLFSTEFAMSQATLKKAMSKVYFAMGQQDVRHYLNGALFDINQGVMKCVATDGHRLAFSSVEALNAGHAEAKVILPRKSVLELMRLLDNSEENVMVCINADHFRIKSSEFTFTSKLIHAQYPDYDKLIPRTIENTAITNREVMKQALTRASILSNEKFRGVRLQLETDTLRIVANNPEQEEAEEIVQMEYQGNGMEIGFNVVYLLEVFSAMSSKKISWSFSDPNGSVLIEPTEKDNSLYVVMPMRL
ncbi:MAG TPA: DNA polymerase III subunit beta [Gammaproteobacteria bacterium]|nr:DNA polymerase III subunit beta [Gammaproteobacteria bacterium]